MNLSILLNPAWSQRDRERETERERDREREALLAIRWYTTIVVRCRASAVE